MRSGSHGMDFFEELKRRNVFRVGIAYAVSAWVVLQFADLVLENTEAPGWVMDVLMLFIALGFLVSLVIAWAFELTPEGIKREKDVKRDESITHETGRKLEWITLAAASLVLVLFLFERFGGDAPPEPPANAEVAASPATAAEETNEAETPAGTLDSETERTRGVAVLPFANLSTDEANAFFAGGVHEDVLAHLARIEGLRIISRTSMNSIAEQNLGIREIGQQLDVSHVLEGSVRRAGDQVRITAQLIDASTDQQLWSATYDRRLDDIFAIQSDIAGAIANQLQAELSPEARIAMEAPPTRNVLAYDYFLKAREADRVWRGAQGFREMREYLEQAVAMDPDFLDAKVKLAYVYGRLVWTSADPDGTFRVLARELSDEIQASAPDSSHATRARADYRYTVMRDYDEALQGYQELLAEDPNNIDLLLAVSSSLKRLNRYEEGLPVIDRALALDPENAVLPAERVFHLQGLRRIDESIVVLEDALALFPDDVSTRLSLADTMLLEKGDLEAYRSLLPDRFGSLGSLENVHFEFYSGHERRLGLREYGLEASLVVLENLRVEGDPWVNAMVDLSKAELLNLAGREAESQALAVELIQDFKNFMAQGMKFPSTRPRYWLASYAYAACLANDPATANLITGIADTLPPDDESELARTQMYFVLARAECGDVEGAWALQRSMARPWYGPQDWDLVHDPIYAHYFSDLPEYQAAVERQLGAGA